MAYRDTILADTPATYLELEQTTGNPTNSGSHSIASYTIAASGVTKTATGKVGNAWQFTTKGGYAVATHGSDDAGAYNDGTFSMEIWFKGGTSTGNDYLMVLGNVASGNYAYVYKDVNQKAVLFVKGSNGTGQGVVGTATIADNAWHHIVATVNGTTKKLYVDGVLQGTNTTTTGTFAPTTHQVIIGNNSSANISAIGTYDEFATYPNELTAAQVTAHYNAGNAPASANGGYTAQVSTASALMVDPLITVVKNGGYTAQVSTASALMVNPTYSATTVVDRTYAAQVSTASATMTEGTGAGNSQTLTVTEDIWMAAGGNYTGSSHVNSPEHVTLGIAAASDVGDPTTSPLSRTYLKFSAVTGPDGEATRTLTLTPSSSVGSTNTLYLYRIDGAWSESTVTFDTRPPETYIKSVTLPAFVAGTPITVDVSGVDGGFGIALGTAGTGPWNVRSSEYTAVAGRNPYATVTTAPSSNGSYAAQVMTASGSMPNVTIDTTRSASVGAAPATAAAVFVDPVVFAIGDRVMAAQPMEAQATMTADSGFSSGAEFNATAMTADATTVDAEVSTTGGALIYATALTAAALLQKPALVNDAPIAVNEAEDTFFQRVMADTPQEWYRMGSVGATEPDRMGSPLGLTYNGVTTGLFDGPEGRQSVYFNGSAFIEEVDHQGSTGTRGSYSATTRTLEFYIRTTKQNQFIMVGADHPNITELYLDNGRVKLFQPSTNYYTSGTSYIGFKNVADGQWHQISLVSYYGSGQDEVNQGVSVYIDGKLDFRRYRADLWTGFPDYIGSRPTILNAGTANAVTIAPLSPSLNFVGDMSEVVAFNRVLNRKELAYHFYLFMGWSPVGATPMEAFAFTPAEARGKGNQKRALYLWWSPETDAYNVGGGAFSNKVNLDPVLDAKGNFGTYNLEGYKIFSKSVTFKPTLQGPNVGEREYRHAVTDQRTLISLEHDLDILDYDVIMFGDWPDEGYEFDNLREQFTNFNESYERLLSELRDANDQGVGLMITHPRLAVDLGIVDRVEWVPTLKESFGNQFAAPGNVGFQGNAVGNYDYGSAVKFPWNITADAGLANAAGGVGAFGTGRPMDTSPTFLDFKAYFYEDMNFNNRFRVRALVDGLTNIPSYMIKDAVYHVDRDLYGDDFPALDLIDRRAGLFIGDEFIFHGNNAGGLDWSSADLDGQRAGRPNGTYATPVPNVKAGTVVTTFGAKHWRRKVEVDNPYKDYATTITLDRGDVLAGRAVGGRIFVNFSEQPNRFQQSLPADILPGSPWDDGTAVWPNLYLPDTAAQRNWEFSGTRVSVSNTALNGTVRETTVVMPDGSSQTSREIGGNGLIFANYNNLFGRVSLPRWDMTKRGMWWVGRGEAPQAGEKRVASTPLEATAQMPSPIVTAQKDGGYVAQPMVALAEAKKVAEDQSGEVQIVTLPMTARVEFTGFSRVISAAPMTAEAELVENFDLVHASGEQVVLTLHGVDTTLYLKEEA